MSDEIETIDKNPKSWVAWKREAERLQEIIDGIALAAMDSETVIVVGDDGGDALSYRRLIQSFESGTKLYRHAQPAQVVPDEKDKTVDADDHPLLWSFNEGWNACRAAMLQEVKP